INMSNETQQQPQQQQQQNKNKEPKQIPVERPNIEEAKKNKSQKNQSKSSEATAASTTKEDSITISQSDFSKIISEMDHLRGKNMKLVKRLHTFSGVLLQLQTSVYNAINEVIQDNNNSNNSNKK